MLKWIWPPIKRPHSDDVIKLLVDTIRKTPVADAAELTKKTGIAEKSLRDVVHLTEYEDEKANRILTAVAFLSAFAAVLFTETMGDFPFAAPTPGGCAWQIHVIYPYFYYWSFAAYALLMTWGAVLVIKGIGPFFNIPAIIETGDKVKSLLFFKLILGATPQAWAENYRDKTPQQLEQQLFENYVVESYLVAGKIPYKIAFVELGTKYFYWSTIILMIWATTTVVAENFYK